MSEALEAAEAALAAAGADEAEAVVQSERSGLARFAGGDIHQPTLIDNVVVSLRVVRDGRVGIAASNRLDADGLRELALRAGEAADASVAEPGFPGLAAPVEVPRVDGFDEETAALAPADQARLAGTAIAAARSEAYGFFTSAVTELAVASSTGLRASQRMTDAMTLVLAASAGRSGYAEATSWRVAGLDPATVGREAFEKAERTAGAVAIDAGRYRAVLEPYAVADLLQYFAWDSFGAQGLLEERSFLSGRLGERLFDEKITIVDDALDPRGLPKAFDFEGCPKCRVPIVENGVVCGVVWDRATAARAGSGQATTGHAPPASLGAHGPAPTALSLAGGEAGSVAELAELVGDGIHVTRLHYLSVVDPREGIVTGMTRDGTFRIRDGRVAEPLLNLRFTVSVPELLADVPGLTRAVSLLNTNDFYGERYPQGLLAPALATAAFDVGGVGSSPGL